MFKQTELFIYILIGILTLIYGGLLRLLPIAWYWQILIACVAAPVTLILLCFIPYGRHPQVSPPEEEPEDATRSK